MSSRNTSQVHVFAYGSNMCVPRIRARVPSARLVATGFVRERRFLFHKLSQDGSAKADAALTGRPDDRVWGVVLRVRKDEKPILDRHEFLGVGYDEHQETIVLPDGNSVRAWLYVARTEAIVKDVKPYSWYKAFVLHGAREHRLPDDYVAQLERFPCTVDPDQQRHEANHRLLTHEASCPDDSSMLWPGLHLPSASPPFIESLETGAKFSPEVARTSKRHGSLC